MGISSHKTELANCGSSNRAENLQGLDFGNRSQVNKRLNYCRKCGKYGSRLLFILSWRICTA